MIKRMTAMLLMLSASGPALAEAGGPLGTWRTPERGGLIEVTACDGGPRDKGLCGKIVGGNKDVPAAEQVDRLNKNPALRSRPLFGMFVFRGLKPVGKTWTGAIYNPEDGGTYQATITLKSANALTVRGCIVWPLCKTQTWARLK